MLTSSFAGSSTGLSVIATYDAKHGGYDDLEVDDVTGDGRDDLVVMSGQGLNPDLSVLAQLPEGGFEPAAEYHVSTNDLTHGIGIGDVTGDGRKDVVASYGGNQPGPRIAVLAQAADGTLAAPVSYASYDIPEPVEVRLKVVQNSAASQVWHDENIDSPDCWEDGCWGNARCENGSCAFFLGVPCLEQDVYLHQCHLGIHPGS